MIKFFIGKLWLTDIHNTYQPQAVLYRKGKTMHAHEHGHRITEHFFEHIFSHTIADTRTLIPFLLIVFLVLEYMEHSISEKSVALIEKAGRSGPLLGGIVGALPQCGFSVMATNLFAGRIISIGTVVAVYLSTSDEMLAIMLGSSTGMGKIIKIVLIKAAIGIAAGFGVDFAHRIREKYNHHKGTGHIHSHNRHSHEDHSHREYINDFCLEEDCHCEGGSPVLAAVRHTVKIFAVIFVVTFLLNMVIDLAGLEIIEETMAGAGIWAPVVAGVVGMIPNCASSVAITQLYLSGAISFGTAMAGLLTGSGIAWIVLFRVNPHSRQNFKIMGTVFFTGVASGIILNALGVVV